MALASAEAIYYISHIQRTSQPERLHINSTNSSSALMIACGTRRIGWQAMRWDDSRWYLSRHPFVSSYLSINMGYQLSLGPRLHFWMVPVTTCCVSCSTVTWLGRYYLGHRSEGWHWDITAWWLRLHNELLSFCTHYSLIADAVLASSRDPYRGYLFIRMQAVLIFFCGFRYCCGRVSGTVPHSDILNVGVNIGVLWGWFWSHEVEDSELEYVAKMRLIQAVSAQQPVGPKRAVLSKISLQNKHSYTALRIQTLGR